MRIYTPKATRSVIFKSGKKLHTTLNYSSVKIMRNLQTGILYFGTMEQINSFIVLTIQFM